MSDDSFDSFDAGEDGLNEVQPIEDDDPDDRHNSRDRRDLSMAMTQKLFGNQGGSTTNNVEYDENDYVEPRNRFEEILKEENVRIVKDHSGEMMDMDMESYEKFVVFGGNLNHEELIRNLEKRMETDRGELFGEFETACNRDQQMLALYLSPAKSRLGLQDTIFRAFLQIRSTQTKSFDLLLQKLNILAKRQDDVDLLLAQTCVAHMRHLNRLFEPQSVFNTIFEFEWRFWSPNVRNDLIVALPEIFTELSLQQATAIRLNREIEETQGIADLPSFQLQIVETLRLLRMDSSVARQIRVNLCNLCMTLDVFCFPSVIAFALASLLTGQQQQQGALVKADEEEAHFHEMLRQLSRLLKIDSLRKKTAKSDTLIVEIYGHFLKFLQLDKRAWKHITTWIAKKNSKNSAPTKKEPEDSDDDSGNAPEDAPEDREASEDSNTWITTFEAFLIFSLLSNSDSCPATFLTAVNSKILNIPTAFTTKFLKIVDLVISFKKFATCHLSALIHVARHCFWSPDSNIRQMGVSMWKQLFVGMEKKDRVKVFTELMKHFSQSETECEAVLDVFFKVIKSTNSSVIQEFSTQIQKCIELIHKLSIPNIKRLFQVMLMMSSPSSKSSKSSKFEIDEIINRFLISVSEREKFLGVLALLMKIQVEMGKKHTENQETLIREGVQRIQEAVKSSSPLRGAFYEHMTIVLQQHKRAEEIRFIAEWSQDLLKRFKEDFFEAPASQDSESISEATWILKPVPERLLEIAPMFELIKEMQVLKMRWREEDQDSMTSSYDICVIKDLNFAFEATLPTQDSDFPSSSLEKLNHLFFLIQWSRTVLNAFLAQSSIDFLSSDEVSKLATKKFYAMMDSEKKLAASLIGHSTWNVPNLKFERGGKGDVILVNTEKPKAPRARKRKSDETTVVTEGQTEGDATMMNEGEESLDGEVVVKEIPNVKSQLTAHYIPLKLRPIVHLIKLAKRKRSCLKYLCDDLQSVFDHLIRQKKKTPPMLAARSASAASPISQRTLDKLYHGDTVTVWFCVKKATEQVWGIVELVFDFFGALPDASQEVRVTMQKDMEELGEKSLNLMHCILSGELYGGEEKLSPTEKSERKSVLIRIIEKKMLNAESLSNDSDKARVEVGKYLAKSAEFSPTPAVAVAILNVFEDLKLDEEEEADTRKIMAKYALAYLKKDWSKVDEVWSKGPKYTAAVRDILHHYIRLRKEKDQLLAIQWILTNKVVQLVPEDDKRKSCVFSQQSDDDLLEKEDQKATFYCISKATFGVIFKTIFSNLNTRCLKYDMSATAAKNQGVNDEDTLEFWETASSCFLILCLLLRINKIRTTAVLTTAIREGKQFLITVSKKSSFIYLMDNITKGTNFDTICKKVEKILSAVQQGNRVLQSIGTYAKTHKCVHLLKKFPELRAESENCLRVIHSAMVKNECLNAFTVGLVKSRSIDGEIITDQPDTPMDSDED